MKVLVIPKPDTILEKLEKIHDKCRENEDISEDKLKRYFHKSGILEELGYEEEDIHVEETVKGQKRTDIHVTDDYGNVRAVIEFKKPTVRNLREHFDQLWNRYMKPLKAKYGFLYNGHELFFYERIRNNYDKKFGMNVLDLERQNVSTIVQHIKKPRYDLTKIKVVTEYLKEFEDPEEKLNLKDEASREHFFESFKLKKDSVFGELLKASINLFNEMERKGDFEFLKSAYDFWKISYAKKPESVPENWKPFIEESSLDGKDESLYKFMFCLETTYALFTRLILGKSAEDYHFADIRFVGFIENEIEKASHYGDIPRSSWAKITQELIANLKNKLVSSVFEEDIFYWWTEPYEKREFIDFFKLSGDEFTLAMDEFGEKIRKILLTFCKFDFSEIKGDPLGILYQGYFDKETRKALGEFYTPQEVVDYILNAVDYEGRKVLDKRLLDPACGSGTFIVTALKRYLEASKGVADEEGWDVVLDDLCNKYRLVGFDIHPFATIMAQTQFMVVLLPYYRKAVEDAKRKGEYFTLQRVPIFRTDSLLDESEGEESKMTLKDYQNGKKISMNIKLPVIKEEADSFFETGFEMPHTKMVRKQSQIDIYDNEEYFATLQALFDTIKQQAKEMQKESKIIDFDKELFIKTMKRHYLSDKNFEKIAEFFHSFAKDLLQKIHLLQTEFEDGRLIKSIEDVFLSALLKNEQKYNFVVGNPPYVRIDYLPEDDKERHQETYSNLLSGKWDLYMPFLFRGGKWLKESGQLGYICSNKFFLNESAEKLREKILEYNWKEIVDLSGIDVFENALPAPAIIVFSNRDKTDIINVDVKTSQDIDPNEINEQSKGLDRVENVLQILLENVVHYEISQSRYNNDKEYLFSIYPDSIQELINKIESISSEFGDNCKNIGEGDTKRKEELNVINEEEYQNLSKKKRKDFKKVIRGSDVEKYYSSWITSKRDYILNLKDIEHEKRILIKDMSPKPVIAPEYGDYRCLRTIYCATLKKQKREFIDDFIGQLNSKLVFFYYLCYYYTSQMSPRKGNYRFREQFVKRLPVLKEKSEIGNKVKKIEKRKNLRDKIKEFPTTYNFYGEKNQIKQIMKASHSSISPCIQKTQDGLYGVVIGKRKKEEPILVDTEEKAEFVKKSFEGDSVKKGEKIEILVPKSNQDVKEILEEYRKDKEKLEEMPSIEELEEEINEIVYELYGLDEEDIDVIEDFLEKF